MRSNLVFAVAIVAPFLAACADDSPTEVGRDLVPGGQVETFEVLLDSDQFLVSDTIVTGFSRPSDLNFMVVAAGEDDGVEARSLMRFGRYPVAVQVPDGDDGLVPDSSITFAGARLVLLVDTAGTAAPDSARLRLFRTVEEWDPGSTTWEFRSDSAGEQEQWAVPGAGASEPVDSGFLTEVSDTVSIPVDSQTVAAWGDSTDATRGALVAAETAGTHIRATGAVLRLQVRPSTRPDTLIDITVGGTSSTFIFHPEPPRQTGLAIAGVPGWRSYLQFGDSLGAIELPLGAIELPCPGGEEDCSVTLDRVAVNLATLVLTPRASPPGFALRDSLQIAARPVLMAPGIPLSRVPLGSVVGGAVLGPEDFAPGGADGAVEITVTNFIRDLVEGADGEPVDDDTEDSEATMLGLVSAGGGGVLGVAPFAGLQDGSEAPKLRLVVTVTTGLEIQ